MVDASSAGGPGSLSASGIAGTSTCVHTFYSWSVWVGTDNVFSARCVSGIVGVVSVIVACSGQVAKLNL